MLCAGRADEDTVGFPALGPFEQRLFRRAYQRVSLSVNPGEAELLVRCLGHFLELCETLVPLRRGLTQPESQPRV